MNTMYILFQKLEDRERKEHRNLLSRKVVELPERIAKNAKMDLEMKPRDAAWKSQSVGDHNCSALKEVTNFCNQWNWKDFVSTFSQLNDILLIM